MRVHIARVKIKDYLCGGHSNVKDVEEMISSRQNFHSFKKSLLTAALAVVAINLAAQNATNSPYSQYGYGAMADQANGASVGMSGLSQGWREGNTVNFGNPASYAALDSLTFIFDAGVSGICTNFTEAGRKLNAYNSSFDYVIGAFRAFRRVGLAFGVMPYSNIGYSYSSETTIGTDVYTGNTETTTTNTYSGDGGIHQVFLGIGVDIIKTGRTNVSVGVNGSYVWGDYTKSVINSYSDVYVNTLSKYYLAEVNSYKVDAALQWSQQITKNDRVTLGATYTFGHDMKSDPYCRIVSYNSQTGVADTTDYHTNHDLMMPTTIAAGVVWNHANRFRVGLDWKYEMWSKIDYPVYEVVDDVPYYTMQSGQFKDRHKFIVGGEYCHNERGRKWADRIRYRLGATYSTPYLKINGSDGPKEYGVSAGIGLPILNTYNNRSVLNVSASWTRIEAPGMITENTFRINLGLTFNERWFAKWQVE
ncbi:MAG: hypothetical protein LUC26_05685 [Prevotella sp.]|nr:hypothetical protein [Prevotella sp.]